MLVSAFDFDLPEALIATRPADPRDSARLLHVTAGRLADHNISDLPGLLEPGDLLVFNDTRVIPARLTGRRGAAAIELLLHRRCGVGVWEALARPARRLSAGDVISFAHGVEARVTAKAARGRVTVDFALDDAGFQDFLSRAGSLPLPPYIAKRRPVDDRDDADYQTIFADPPGAVAAPTAGLHFTAALLRQCRDRGLQIAIVTLHVGAGTFLPVTVDDTADHEMLPERGAVGPAATAAIARARAGGGRVVAVGTTVLRLLETAAAETGAVRPFSGDADLFITPGYHFKAADLLLTNFHLPRSTLIMLAAAFVGLERIQRAYAHAIAAGYKFYSYGDATLLERRGDAEPV